MNSANIALKIHTNADYLGRIMDSFTRTRRADIDFAVATMASGSPEMPNDFFTRILPPDPADPDANPLEVVKNFDNARQAINIIKDYSAEIMQNDLSHLAEFNQRLNLSESRIGSGLLETLKGAAEQIRAFSQRLREVEISNLLHGANGIILEALLESVPVMERYLQKLEQAAREWLQDPSPQPKADGPL